MLVHALHLLPLEAAHRLAIWGLGHGLVRRQPADAWPRLATRLCGLDLPNPLGLAVGFNSSQTTGLKRQRHTRETLHKTLSLTTSSRPGLKPAAVANGRLAP